MERNDLIALGVSLAFLCFCVYTIFKTEAEDREFRYIAAQNGVPVVMCVK